MSSFTVQSVRIEDVPSIATATMSAFWNDSYWRQMWTVPLSSLIILNAQRLPHRLNTDRHKQRFENVVDTATGEVLGHARWIVPDGMEDMWETARGPAAKDDEEAEKFKKMYESADWNSDGRYGHETSPAQNDLRKKTIDDFNGAPYLCKSCIEPCGASERSAILYQPER